MASTPNTFSPAPTEQADCGYVASAPTTLRCAKCSKPLMVKDAKRTPTGYVCPNYVKARIATFYNNKPSDYALAALVAGVCGVAAGFALSLVGGIILWFIFLVGPFVGGLVAEVVRAALQRRRGQYIWVVACVAFALAGGVVLLFSVPLLLQGVLVFRPNIIPLVGLALSVSTLGWRLRI